MTELTRVELLHWPDRIEHWIRFGRHVREDILDRRRRNLWFAAGTRFAYVRWAANEHGTLVSRIDIVRACGPGEPLTTVPGIAPGGEVLLRLSAWPKVQQVLHAIDAVDALGIDPAAACPDHWRHVHNRIVSGTRPRPYTRARHRAWLKRREIESC